MIISDEGPFVMVIEPKRIGATATNVGEAADAVMGDVGDAFDGAKTGMIEGPDGVTMVLGEAETAIVA